MKKFLTGCLIVAVLGVVAIAVGGYFLYRAASPVIENARSYLQGFSELDDLERAITNQSPHTAPETGELTEAQVQRFARVQDSVRAALGQRMTEIEEKYQHLKSDGVESRQPSVAEVVGGLSEIARVFTEARRFQVTALNAEGFSQAEYSWVRDRIFQAAGVEVTSMIDLSKIEEAVRTGTGIDNLGTDRLPRPNIPEKNRALVKPHINKMDQWLPLAFFGL
ncbi:MAG: hypothetical protein H0T71_11465 [Acidobacteria bacterium]|nr:hypothetical protein [Acidobacteriota bacterium]